MKLEGRVAILTGAGQGIGRAIAEKLGRGRPRDRGGQERRDGGQDAAEYRRDRPRPRHQRPGPGQRPGRGGRDQFGRIDILVNHVAIVPFVPWEELDFAELRRVMSVNIDGMSLMCKAVYPHMKAAGYGRIVNIASNVVTAGTPNMAHYVSSRAPSLPSPGRWPPRWACTTSPLTPWLPA